MLPGITDDQLKTIKEILKNYPYDFYLFGSRVKGNWQPNSDLDMLLVSHRKLSVSELAKIKDEFYNSKLPYIVNIIEKLSCSESFYKEIQADLYRI